MSKEIKGRLVMPDQTFEPDPPPTPTPGLIYAMISKVMADITAIAKERENVVQKFKFRGIEDMYNQLHPIFVRHSVFMVPFVMEWQTWTIEKQKDGYTQYGYRTIQRIRHRLYASDGSYIDSETLGEGIDNSDKATNKATSAAMKYWAAETFMIPFVDLEDGDRDTPDAGKSVSGATDKAAFFRPGASPQAPAPYTATAAPKTPAPAAPPPARPPATGKPITDPQIRRFWAIARNREWDSGLVKRMLANEIGSPEPKDIRGQTAYDRICTLLDKGPGVFPDHPSDPIDEDIPF